MTTRNRLTPFALSALAALSLTGCGSDDSAPAIAALPSEVVAAVDQSAIGFYAVSPAAVAQVASAALPGIPGTYSRSGNTVTVTLPNHHIRDGLWVNLDFSAGTGGTVTDGNYKATYVDADTFTLTSASSGTITGGNLLRNPIVMLPATYAQSGTTVTVTLTNHGLAANDTVDLDFTSGIAVDANTSVTSVVDANTFTVTASASATTGGSVTVGIGTSFASHDVQMHPSGKWLYVASGYDCFNGFPHCYGGDTITQFSINWTTGVVAAVDVVRMDTTDAAVPVRMAFNPAGSRLVVQDESLDGLRLFSVDAATGELTEVANSGLNTTSNTHAVAFSADGNYVYHGDKVFGVTTAPDAIAVVTAGTGSASGLIAGGTLFTISPADSTLKAYSLASPTAPALLHSVSSVIPNRDVAANAGGALLVAAGFRGLKAYTFDGATLAAAVPATGSGELQADGSASLDTVNTLMYRGISMNSTGNLVVASYFTFGTTAGAAQGGVAPSGFLFAQVGADGALTRIANLPVAKYARIARFIKKP